MRLRGWACALAWAWVVLACGDDARGPFDAGGGDDASDVCAADAECDDGLFCNGAEACAPRAEGADARGCVATDAPCGAASCNESTDACAPGCGDADGDGRPDEACGGDDCDDTDPDRYPGNAEVCDPEGHDEDCDATTFGARDVDGDGFSSDRCCNGAACANDCDDARRGTNPSVPEVCNGLDDDCDGATDEGLRIELFRDADHDGVGIRAATALACPGEPGYAAAAGDCDDALASVRPTAPEICDELDNDCDGVVDEATLSVPWYVDDDGDGWGVVSADAPSVDSCVPPAGRAIRIGDCDDGDALIAPTARERCNAIDDDCDGRPDFQIGARDFEDDDGDGVPDAACMAASADCDDRDPTIVPGSVELCDLFDNDCDATIDEGAAERAWYADMDGDGYGDPAASTSSCAIVAGRVLDATDCDDLNASTHPGEADACGGQVGIDDDCDEVIDEGGNALAFYADLDGDGWGAGEQILACQGDARTATRGGDCDDGDARVSPAALDDCAAVAGVDDDCDGRVDETLAPRVFYADGDGDGYGAGAPAEGCSQPTGTSVRGGDCDDTDRARNPGVPDDCGTALGVDDDCDVSVDEALAPRTYYLDRDGDGYGAGTAMQACTVPSGATTAAGDCDDASASRNPAAPDDCTRAPLVDDDCDGRVDEAAVLTSWYRDTDGDGYGSGTATPACLAPSGSVARSGDCDESRSAVSPGALDGCTGLAGIDDDCDSSTDEAVALQAFYPDADGDGYGSGTAVQACTAPSGHAALGGDCNDGSSTQSPGRADDCTTTLGTDDDCDGDVDEGATLTSWYRDADGDGFGNLAIATSACARPTGYVADSTDCNDGAAAARPGASEVCNDLLDNDCDGPVDCDDTECSAGCPVLRVASGDMQSAPLHMPFAQPIVVRLEDRLGAPLAGRVISLRTQGVSLGTLYTATGYASTTDASGEATFTLRAGLAVGAETITFGAPGATSITATTTGAAPADGTIFTVYNGARIATFASVPGPARDGRGTNNLTSVTVLHDGAIAVAVSDRILRIDPSGHTTVLVGGGTASFSEGALGTSIRLTTNGTRIAADPARGRLYYEQVPIGTPETSGCVIRYVDTTTGSVHAFAGSGTCAYGPEGGPAATTDLPYTGDLVVSDTGVVYQTSVQGNAGWAVRAIDTSGFVRFALRHGDPSGPYTVANSSGFARTRYVAPIPGSPDIYVQVAVSNLTWPLASRERLAILRVAPDATFTVVAGGGLDAVGEGIAATSAQIEEGAITVLSDGSIVLAETASERIRRISGRTITTIAGTSGMSTYAGDGTPASSALLTAPNWVATWRGTHFVFADSSVVRAVW